MNAASNAPDPDSDDSAGGRDHQLELLDRLAAEVDRTASRVPVAPRCGRPSRETHDIFTLEMPGLVIARTPPPRSYPRHVPVVVTPHADALADLAKQLLPVVWPHERLGAAVRRSQRGRPAETQWGLLRAVLAEARLYVEEDRIRSAEQGAMAAFEAAQGERRKVRADRAAARQWRRAGLPGKPRPGRFLFTPDVGIAFNAWCTGNFLYVAPEMFAFESSAPIKVFVSRDHDDGWVALPASDAAVGWPRFPADWEMQEAPVQLLIDKLPGTWARAPSVWAR